MIWGSLRRTSGHVWQRELVEPNVQLAIWQVAILAAFRCAVRRPWQDQTPRRSALVFS
jgi:hypothetical protein